MRDKLKDLDLRYEDLESQLGDPRVYGDAEKLRQVIRELKELLPVETYVYDAMFFILLILSFA